MSVTTRYLTWRLTRSTDALRRARRDLAEVDAQSEVIGDEADDLAVRALVSDGPLDRSESHAAAGHAEALRREQQRLRAEIARLEALQDDLLDRVRAASPCQTDAPPATRGHEG